MVHVDRASNANQVMDWILEGKRRGLPTWRCRGTEAEWPAKANEEDVFLDVQRSVGRTKYYIVYNSVEWKKNKILNFEKA